MSPEKSTISSRSHQGTEIAFLPDSIGRMPEEESLRDVLRVLRKRKYFVLSFALGALAVALLLCSMMRPQYTSTATLLVDKDSSAGLDLGPLSSLASDAGGSDVKTDLQTHATLLQSDTTVLKVVKDLNLQSVKPYKVTPRSFWGSRSPKAAQDLPIEKDNATRQRILALFASRLKVTPTQDTRLITITYRDYDADRAAEIANSLVSNYIREYLQTRYEATAKATDWLSGQLTTLRANVEESQRRLSDYEHETGLSVLMLGLGMGVSDSGASAGGSSGGGSGGIHVPAVDKLALLNTELTTAESNRIAKEAIYRLTQTQSPDVVIALGSSDLTSVGGGSAVVGQGNGLLLLQNLRGQEAAARMSYADITTKYGAKNPRLAEMEAQITALNGQIHEELKRINQRAQNDFVLAQKTEDGIRGEYAKQEGVVNKLNDSTIRLEILAGEALSSRALYEGLSTKLQEAGVEAGVKATNLSLVDPARPSAHPVRPDWLMYPTIALGAGLLMGLGGAFVKENLDDAIVTSETAERIAHRPVLAHIPLLRPEDKVPLLSAAENQDVSPLLNRPNSPAAESYRALRTAIGLSAIDDPLQLLLVSSPLAGEGKTTLCYNIAVASAQQGKRVLLIDADQRKSRLHSLFQVRKNPGLSDILAGQASFEAAVRPHSTVDNCFILPAGVTPPNPADLLGSHRFDDLLTVLRAQYELIIIDSPPVLLVTDAVILSTKVDGTILVIRSGLTTRPALAHASEALERSTGRWLGMVLNAVDTRSAEYYYAYGYYGKSKYYGEEDSKS